MPIWDAYRNNYNAKMRQAAFYERNGNPFKAGFISGRAQGDVAMDVASVAALGYGGLRFASNVGSRVGVLGNRAYNVGTMGLTRGSAVNAVVDGLSGVGDFSRVFSGRRMFTPGYYRSLNPNSLSYRVTGARTYHPSKHGVDPELWASKLYEEFRSWNSDLNIKTISNNTGIPEQMISSVRQHLFFDYHTVPKISKQTGAITKEVTRFDPCSEIAELWDLASTQRLDGENLIKFERLIAHEYVERGLMKIGYPYRSFDNSAITVNRWGDFSQQFNNKSYGAHDRAPLSDHTRKPWAHWEKRDTPVPFPSSQSNKTKYNLKKG